MNNIYDNKEFFEEYSKMDRSKKGLSGAGEWHQLQLLIPNLLDKTVLDLGCGYGWHSKHCINCGARHVVAFDLSEKMIEVAKTKNFDEKIEYKVSSIDDYDYPEKTFDLVISNLVLHYVRDLEAVYRNVYNTLKNNGIFLFNIEHPIFTSGINQDWIYDENGEVSYWPIDDYFNSGDRITKFLDQVVTKEHHTLTEIINGLLNTGFVIETLEEAIPSEDMMDIPGMVNELKRPMMLIVKARKVT